MGMPAFAPQFLEALPAYPGGKRRLLGAIFGLIGEECPRQAWPGLTFCDAFLGAGSVALTGKALGFHYVIANDLAERSAIVGRALLVNSRAKITSDLVLRLFRTGPRVHAEPPALLGKVPPPARRFLKHSWGHLHGGSFPGVTRDLMALLVIRAITRYFPLGLPTASDAQRITDADFDAVTPARLTHYLRAGQWITRPAALLSMAEQINCGILPGSAEMHQRDVFDFLPEVVAEIVYLDPPYGGTQAYERTFALVDEFLGAEPLPASVFSSSKPPLDELLDACRHIPIALLSSNNSLSDAAELEALVAQHRRVVRVLSIPYRHYGPVATAAKNAANREILILAVRR